MHTKIKMKPSAVNKRNEKYILNTIYNKKPQITKSKKPKFNVGDFVRISKYKKNFDKGKGYLPNYTTEIFKIVRFNKKYPFTYLLEDFEGQPIAGQFYEPELMKTKFPDVYLIEKVIKRKGSKSYVSWLGFDSKHNSWINNKDLV